MAIFGKYFDFNGKSSKDFGLKIVSFDMLDSIPMGLERTINIGEMNIFRQRPNHFGATYSSTLQFTVTVVKDPLISDKNFSLVQKSERLMHGLHLHVSQNYFI